MVDLSDEELMVMFKYGNLDAFDLLFEKYKKPLLNFIFRMVSDRQLAEDLFQEIFVQVAQAAGDYHVSAKFSTWLFKIATNRCINEIKSKRYRDGSRSLSLSSIVFSENDEGDYDELVDLIPGNNTSPEEEAMANELQSALEAALLKMTEDLKTVFLLYEVQGYAYERIADILDAPMGTVKTRLHRAREFLRKELKKYIAE